MDGRSLVVRWAFLAVCLAMLTACDSSSPSGSSSSGNSSASGESTTAKDKPGSTEEKGTDGQSNTESTNAPAAMAAAADVAAARKRLDELGPKTKYTLQPGDRLTEIVIQDGSGVTADDIGLFGKLTDLEKLQIFNCRALDDEMAAKLAGLKGLTSLALTNTVINDVTVELIVKSFPNLVDLDLSSNTNMTSGVLKVIAELPKLQRLTLVQNQFNDLSARRLSKLTDLRTLDLRGNMEAGDMAMEVVADLPKLTGFKHRSTAVSDFGMEHLSRNQTLDSLLLQDFVITDQSGPHLAKLGKLSQLEIFRCQGFGTEGVLALKGMGLTRFTLRDLPNVDDRAMEVFDDLPKLKRVYLHELTSVGDSGLKHLANAKTIELLDIWTVPQLTDATVDVIASLPNLKELSLRSTGVTDAAVDKLLAMKNLQTLTFKENGSVTAEAAKKLANRKWTKLDTGAADSAETAAP
jgi:Leucine-rich repeat (LRR) protein